MITVVGPVGAGKSTVAKMLSCREQIPFYQEPVVQNPYLEAFYQEPHKYAFPMQIFLLRSMFHHTIKAQRSGELCVIDMSMYGNDIFSNIHHSSGYMSLDDYHNYTELSELLKSIVKPPELLVYLQCSPDVSVSRIMRRGRPSEQLAPMTYWRTLHEQYEEWYNKYDGRKILVNVDHVDVVSDEGDEDYILDVIMEALPNNS